MPKFLSPETVKRAYEAAIKYGRAAYETFPVNPDNCAPWDGIEYAGHRLGKKIRAFQGQGVIIDGNDYDMAGLPSPEIPF